jgi:hypothetical protein
VFRNLLPGNDCCSGNVISDPLLNNGRLALVPLFRLSAVTSQCFRDRRHLTTERVFIATIRFKRVLLNQFLERCGRKEAKSDVNCYYFCFKPTLLIR